jgi:hypothetical protein
VGNLDKDEQKNLMRQTCSDLIKMYFRVSTEMLDGNMKTFGLSQFKKDRKEGRRKSILERGGLFISVEDFLISVEVLISFHSIGHCQIFSRLL